MGINCAARWSLASYPRPTICEPYGVPVPPVGDNLHPLLRLISARWLWYNSAVFGRKAAIAADCLGARHSSGAGK